MQTLKVDPEFKSLIPPLSDGKAYVGHARHDDQSCFIRLYPHVSPGYFFVEVASMPSGIAEYSKSALNKDYIHLFLAQSSAPITEYKWESFSKDATNKNPFVPSGEKKAINQSVYFIQARNLGLIKIGVASLVEDRMKTLQTGSPDELVLLATESGGSEKEHELHEKFRLYRSHGEWFYPSEALLSYIERL